MLIIGWAVGNDGQVLRNEVTGSSSLSLANLPGTLICSLTWQWDILNGHLNEKMIEVNGGFSITYLLKKVEPYFTMYKNWILLFIAFSGYLYV